MTYEGVHHVEFSKGTPINPSKRLGEELAQGGIERDPDRYLPEDNM